MTRRNGRFLLVCAVAPLLHCSDLATTGTGGSSQTINAQVIFIDTAVSVSADDTAGRGLALHVYSADYLPYEKIGYADSVAADAPTVLYWKAPMQRSFNFLITEKPSGSACFLRDIALKKGSHDTIRCKLGPCRDITGFIMPSDPGRQPPDERYALSIFGSPFFTITDSTSGFTMRNIPDGGYTVSVRSMTKRIMISTIDYPLAVDSLFGKKQLLMLLP